MANISVQSLTKKFKTAVEELFKDTTSLKGETLKVTTNEENIRITSHFSKGPRIDKQSESINIQLQLKSNHNAVIFLSGKLIDTEVFNKIIKHLQSLPKEEETAKTAKNRQAKPNILNPMEAIKLVNLSAINEDTPHHLIAALHHAISAPS